MKYVDLHTHSTASDGYDTPSRLMENARKAGLSAIALTDHDTIDGLREGYEAAMDNGLEFIPGCEISTNTDMGSVHILGLWIPMHDAELTGFLHDMAARRDERNARMVRKLNDLGLAVSLDELREKAGGSIGRPHMAQLLLEKGYVQDRRQAFDKYLGSGGKAYVPKEVLRPGDAVRLLAKTGATVCMAHPLLPPPKPREWIVEFAKNMSRYGLTALEAWHSAHDEEATNWIKELARSLNLGISGGSDYHAGAKPDIKLGEVAPDRRIPMDVLDNLKLMRKREGLPC